MDVSERLLLMPPNIRYFYQKRIELIHIINRYEKDFIFLSDIIDYLVNNSKEIYRISITGSFKLNPYKIKYIEIDYERLNLYNCYDLYRIKTFNDYDFYYFTIHDHTVFINGTPLSFPQFKTSICSKTSYTNDEHLLEYKWSQATIKPMSFEVFNVYC